MQHFKSSQICWRTRLKVSQSPEAIITYTFWGKKRKVECLHTHTHTHTHAQKDPVRARLCAHTLSLANGTQRCGCSPPWAPLGHTWTPASWCCGCGGWV